MKLRDVEVIPGTVIDSADPQCLGRVKANVPGIFQTDDPSTVPWIYPLMSHGSSTYHTVKEGSKIMVWNNKANYMEFWYTPFHELSDTVKNIVADYDNAEILMSREMASGSSTKIYASDSAGLQLAAEESSVKLDPSGEINIDSANGKSVNIATECVKIGQSTEAYQEAVLGQNLQDLLRQLASDLQNLSQTASANPYTSPLAQPFMTAAQNINDAVVNILAANVKVN